MGTETYTLVVFNNKTNTLHTYPFDHKIHVDPLYFVGKDGNEVIDDDCEWELIEDFKIVQH